MEEMIVWIATALLGGLMVGFAIGWWICAVRYERIMRTRIAFTKAVFGTDQYARGYRDGQASIDPETGHPSLVYGTVEPPRGFPYRGGTVLPENKE